MATQAKLRENTDQRSSPVEGLSHLLDAEMKAVNAIILERMGSDVPLIQQLAAYIISAGGKRVRPLLTLASTQIFEGDMQRAQNLAACVEFIHTATLLHDDVVDESDKRRGKDTANTVFGNQASVLVGDFLFSRAFQMMVDDGSLEVLRILSDASAVIAEGEVMQLMTQGNLDTTMEQYEAVIRAKTAALFAAATEIGPVIAGCEEDQIEAMRSYGMNLGMAFQIADDILDYAPAAAALGKNIGDDFKEGKITAPILYAMEEKSTEEQDFWERTLVKRTQKEADIETALGLIEKYDALEKSKMKAKEYAAAAQKSLECVPKSQTTDFLFALIDFTISRNY